MFFQLHHFYMQECYRKSQEGKTAAWMAKQNLKFDPRFEQRMRNVGAISSFSNLEDDKKKSSSSDQHVDEQEIAILQEGEESQPINIINWDEESQSNIINWEDEKKKHQRAGSPVKRAFDHLKRDQEKQHEEGSPVKGRRRYMTTRRGLAIATKSMSVD